MASELEKQMAELMAGVSEIDTGAKKAQADASRARRKSRELDDMFSSVDTAGHKKLTSLMGRQRRKSRDFGDDELKSAFDKFDTDKSGKLNREELMKAIKEAEPSATEEAVQDMINFADKNGDDQIDFEEFKKAITTKPEEAATTTKPKEAAAPGPAPAAAE
uniref:EF-hand domain-containing protein n=1 Tax=Prymnesium polylepis TaxID=72548 RepID=A0A6V4UVM3_9EUKA|mmetsp:Transcript_32142/g.88119  ORF Transcript_32142/g.88119 Transcript_32142/m.88119 type:complete len:162 (+) Transcript_32142:169-654(+)